MIGKDISISGVSKTNIDDNLYLEPDPCIGFSDKHNIAFVEYFVSERETDAYLASINELGQLLSNNEHAHLPRDAITLLRTPRTVNILSKCGEEKVYFELIAISLE